MQPHISSTSARSLALTATLAMLATAACDPADDSDALTAALDSDGTDSEQDTGEPEALVEGDAADELVAERDATANHPYWEHAWDQGQPPVAMGSVADRFCFLTEVAGHFGSSYERARVYAYQGSWWLGGMGFQPEGIRARALCIPRSYYGETLQVSEEYIWRENGPYTDMGPASGRVCMLTHVQGDLNGEDDSIEAYPTGGVGGRWWLGGSSSTGSSGVMGAARCVDIPPSWLEGPFHWAKNPYISTAATPMMSASYYSCGLTKVMGAFDSWAERVGAYITNGQWYLHGGMWQGDWAVSSGTWSTAYCF